MGCLKKDSIDGWYGLLPDDILSAMEKPSDEGVAVSDLLSDQLAGLETPASVVNFVNDNAESFVTIGRARRIRFLAWFNGRDYSLVEKARVMRILSETDTSGDGSAGGVGKVAPYFKEDIRAYAEALGPRQAAKIVDAETLAAITGAGYEVTSELEMRSGGTR